jgi:hypothetical protein
LSRLRNLRLLALAHVGHVDDYEIVELLKLLRKGCPALHSVQFHKGYKTSVRRDWQWSGESWVKVSRAMGLWEQSVKDLKVL